MRAFWDTSAVLSLALHDGCYPEARRVFASGKWTHTASPLVALEAENRIRNMRLTGELTAEEAGETLDWLDHTFALHHIKLHSIKDSRQMAAEGRRLIQHFSPGVPHGTMDVVHVASARLLRTEGFFTFDANQSSLAAAAGFIVKLT